MWAHWLFVLYGAPAVPCRYMPLNTNTFGFGLGDSRGKETRLILPVMLLFLHNGSSLQGDELSSHPHCGCGTEREDDQDNNQQKAAETSTLQQQAARVAFLATGLGLQSYTALPLRHRGSFVTCWCCLSLVHECGCQEGGRCLLCTASSRQTGCT